jgi:polar amino acid transport system substrate-binding protein
MDDPTRLGMIAVSVPAASGTLAISQRKGASMRRFAVLGSVAALGLAVAGLGTSAPSQPTLIGKCAKANLDLYDEGKLTLATDNPAFPPWWGGKAGHGFETSDPYSGQGYESAVAYEVARRLGFTKAEVTWKAVPFVKSYAPGKKTFDWYMAQVSFSPVRARAVDFSNSYYFVNQAVVGIKGTPITKAKSLNALKPFTLGAAIGTTSYNYITRYIRPSEKPKVYDTNNDAVTAMKNKQIEGLVVDFPSTGYITAVQVPTSTVVGRLPTKGTRERFGMVFEKGSSLDSCVNRALAAMRASGKLKQLESKWLAGSAPLLKG